MDESDTQRPTLWIPDHAASSCMGCNTQFWFGRRKHHCRSCGRLFCGDCSEKSVAIPAEQLYSPVRVCDMCYLIITGQCRVIHFLKLRGSQNDILFCKSRRIILHRLSLLPFSKLSQFFGLLWVQITINK